jgi:hypothetical protein
MANASVSAEHTPNDRERIAVSKFLLYTKALNKLSDDDFNELLKKFENKIGKGAYQKIKIQAQSDFMSAVAEHLKDCCLDLNDDQKSRLIKLLNIKTSPGGYNPSNTASNLNDRIGFELDALVKKYNHSDDSQFLKDAAELIDIIKINPEQSEVFFKKNGPMMHVKRSSPREITTTEQVLRGVGNMILIAAFIAGIAVMASAVTGAVLPGLGVSASGITVTALMEFLGLSNAAAYLGISKVMTAAILVFESLEKLSASSNALRLVTGLIGLGFSYGSLKLGFSGSTPGDIWNTMTIAELAELEDSKKEVSKALKKEISSNIDNVKYRK